MKDALRFLVVVLISMLCVIWIVKSGVHNNESVYFPR